MRKIRTVAVSGSSGFIGTALVAALCERGYEVLPIRGRDLAGGASRLDSVDAVIHLAGESIDGRWTSSKKRQILDSRIEGTRAIVDAIAASASRPAALISASATGYYGNRGDTVLDERSSPGDDFLAGVCVAWEREAARAESYGVRTVMMRTGVVLDAPGGALAKMATPYRIGVGGPLGSGAQFFPWIHRFDLVEAYIFALEHDAVTGPVNAVAPDYVRNRRLAQALGAAFSRPALAPAPAFALRAILGEFADSILGGQLVIPAALEDAGFRWRFELIDDALASIYDSKGATAPLRRFDATQHTPKSIEEVFAFFASPHNLQTITPPNLNFRITNAPARIERGSIIEYRLSLRGVPFNWKTLISQWEPPYFFEDVQLSGPYALWRHQHRFVQEGNGTRLDDNVTYALPLDPLSRPMRGFVGSEVASIFAHRHAVIAGILG